MSEPVIPVTSLTTCLTTACGAGSIWFTGSILGIPYNNLAGASFGLAVLFCLTTETIKGKKFIGYFMISVLGGGISGALVEFAIETKFQIMENPVIGIAVSSLVGGGWKFAWDKWGQYKVAKNAGA